MPSPKPGESQKKFVSRCIPIRQHEHPDEDVKQSAAVCYSMFKKAQEQEDLLSKINLYLEGKIKIAPGFEKTGKVCNICGWNEPEKGKKTCATCGEEVEYRKDLKAEKHSKGSVMKAKCPECGKEMGAEIFLGTTCGKCTRKLHKKVTGRK